MKDWKGTDRNNYDNEKDDICKEPIWINPQTRNFSLPETKAHKVSSESESEYLTGDT